MTTLQQELDTFAAEFKAKIPEEVFNTIGKAKKDIQASGVEAQAPKVGDTVPDFELPIVAGAGVGGSFKLSAARANGPVVVVYFRGGWCPYCNITLKRYEKLSAEFKAKGASVVAISAEKPEVSADVAKKNEISFPILQDLNLEVAKKTLGIVYTLPDSIQQLYTGFGIDLATTQARTDGLTGELPLPATFAVGKDGKVVYSFARVDYTTRADPADVVAAL